MSDITPLSNPARLRERSEAIHLANPAVLEAWTATACGLAETALIRACIHERHRRSKDASIL